LVGETNLDSMLERYARLETELTTKISEIEQARKYVRTVGFRIIREMHSAKVDASVHWIPSDKWDAIRKLGHFLYWTHHMQEVSERDVIDSVLEREEEMTTGLGSGILSTRFARANTRLARTSSLVATWVKSMPELNCPTTKPRTKPTFAGIFACESA